MVKINGKEGSNETTTNGSYIGAGSVDRRPFDRNPHFMLDWELLIPTTIAIVLRRLRSAMNAGRGILSHAAWNMKRTIGQDGRLGYLQNRVAMSMDQVKYSSRQEPIVGIKPMRSTGFSNSITVCAVSLFVFSLFMSAPAFGEATTQISTLDQLIAMFDSSSCKGCHEKIYEQWEKSHHARPLIGMDDMMLLTQYLKRVDLPDKPAEKAIKQDFPCFKCHFPQIKYGTDAVAGEIAKAMLTDDKATIRKLNISCLVCHNEKAVVHGRPEKGVVYGNRDVPDHEDRLVKKSPLLKNSLMCGQCHGLGPVLDSPEMPVQCATLYGSYLHAYIPSGGTQSCQECHMRDAGHYMPPNFNDRDELSARLRQSLPMEVQTLAYTFHPDEKSFLPMVVLKTKITSKAGHRIPDG